MENVRNLAAYTYHRYRAEYGAELDEMKLQKMLYFAQRESLVRYREPLFDAVFYGWKYGPILREVREMYKSRTLSETPAEPLSDRGNEIMDYIFKEYANRDSWSLSRLSHGELSWQNSRRGIPDAANSDNPMDLDDIRRDADRIRTRRAQLTIMRALGLLPERE